MSLSLNKDVHVEQLWDQPQSVVTRTEAYQFTSTWLNSPSFQAITNGNMTKPGPFTTVDFRQDFQILQS